MQTSQFRNVEFNQVHIPRVFCAGKTTHVVRIFNRGKPQIFGAVIFLADLESDTADSSGWLNRNLSCRNDPAERCRCDLVVKSKPSRHTMSRHPACGLLYTLHPAAHSGKRTPLLQRKGVQWEHRTTVRQYSHAKQYYGTDTGAPQEARAPRRSSRC